MNGLRESALPSGAPRHDMPLLLLLGCRLGCTFSCLESVSRAVHTVQARRGPRGAQPGTAWSLRRAMCGNEEAMASHAKPSHGGDEQ